MSFISCENKTERDVHIKDTVHKSLCYSIQKSVTKFCTYSVMCRSVHISKKQHQCASHTKSTYVTDLRLKTHSCWGLWSSKEQSRHCPNMKTGEFIATWAVSCEATTQAECKHLSPNNASGFRNETLCVFSGYFYVVTCYTSPQTALDPSELPKEWSAWCGCETRSTTTGRIEAEAVWE